MTEQPADVRDETHVIVTFLEADGSDLGTRGIAEAKAAEMRDRPAAIAEDWNSPEMEIDEL